MKNFCEKDDFINRLNKININSKLEKSGIQLYHEGDDIYIDDSEASTLVIGSTGSGKTQVVTLPLVKTSINAEESFILSDPKGEIHELFKDELLENGYKIIKLDFDNKDESEHYNPFSLTINYYKQNKIDKMLDSLNIIGYYLLNDNESKDADPFWINSAINFFIGVCLKLIENDKDEISVKDVYDEVMKIFLDQQSLENVKEGSLSYKYLAPFKNMPKETFGSVLSVLNVKLNNYGVYVDLNKIIGDTTFNFEDFSNSKCALFIIGKANDYNLNRFIPLCIHQLYNVMIDKNNSKRINIILDEFGMLFPIKDIHNIISYSRSYNLRFTVLIQNLKQFDYVYGKKNGDLIRLCFANIIYLLTNDINTIHEVLDMCLLERSDENVVKLKTMKSFDCIVMRQRLLPFNSSLLPYYKMK